MSVHTEDLTKPYSCFLVVVSDLIFGIYDCHSFRVACGYGCHDEDEE